MSTKLCIVVLEPLRGGMMGQLVTEMNRWSFPDAETIDKISEVKSADGSTMVFKFKGTRKKSLANGNH